MADSKRMMGLIEEKQLTENYVLTTGQIAKFCQVDARTVNRWIDQGLLEAHKLPASKYNRVRVGDYVRFLKDQGMPVPEELGFLDQRRVLIVDDEPVIVKSLEHLLSKHTPDTLQVKTAGNGFQAGCVLQVFRPDLVLLDLNMPGMDGFEVCQYIKANENLKHTKVLIISGMSQDSYRKKAMEAGADDYLKKPFDHNDLEDRVFEFLEMKDLS